MVIDNRLWRRGGGLNAFSLKRVTFCDDIDTIKKNTEPFIDTSKRGWSRSKHEEN
jgi:hypothetical protein